MSIVIPLMYSISVLYLYTIVSFDGDYTLDRKRELWGMVFDGR